VCVLGDGSKNRDKDIEWKIWGSQIDIERNSGEEKRIDMEVKTVTDIVRDIVKDTEIDIDRKR